MKRTISLLLVSAVLLLAGCRQAATPIAKTTDTVVDDYGRQVLVPAAPKRVVSLSPAVTEIMFALGADSMLVGRTEFCVYPPQAASIENIGGISNLNIEKVLSVNPDLIISGSMVPEKVVQQFQTMGVPLVCVIEKPVFEGLYDNIAKIGNLVRHDRQADSLCGVLREEVAAMTQDSESHLPHPTVYYVVGYGKGGNFTAGGNTFINDIITMAGGQNIAADNEGWTYSLEALMQADPDYILIRREDSASFCHTAPYSRLKAVRGGNIIVLEEGILDLQVPRNIELIKRLRTHWGH